MTSIITLYKFINKRLQAGLINLVIKWQTKKYNIMMAGSVFSLVH